MLGALRSRLRWHRIVAGVVPTTAAVLVLGGTTALANVALTSVSADIFTNTDSQHRTQVESDTYQFGNTIVSAFQAGRFVAVGASSDNMFATSTNGGQTWTTGALPGITNKFGGGPFARATDPSVVYNRRFNVWLISSLAINVSGGQVTSSAVVTSRSTDGGLTWSNPVTTATGTFLDKNWITCDNTPTSPFYGNCYTEYDNVNDSGRLKMSRSTNGGLTWGPGLNTGGNATGLGGQPVVRPNGTVLVPYRSNNGQVRSFRSVDGGASWRATVLVSTISARTVPGGLRSEALPSAEMDSAGTAYVVWQDCRFRSGCTANDIVMSKSTSETTWGPVTRVTSDAGEHFIPGVGVDRTTQGGSARVAITYYGYTNANCTAATCQLNVRYVSSTNGGASWSTPLQVAGPMTLSWLANTNQGPMVGDYVSTSVFEGGQAYSVFAVATAPSGGVFNEAMFAPTGGFQVTGGVQSAVTSPVLTTGNRPGRVPPTH